MEVQFGLSFHGERLQSLPYGNPGRVTGIALPDETQNVQERHHRINYLIRELNSTHRNNVLNL